MNAAWYGDTQIAHTLVLSGADLHATVTVGYGRAAEWAHRRGHPILYACLNRLATPPTIALSPIPATTTTQPQPPPPLQVPPTLHFFLAGVPFQPYPQPAYHIIAHHEGLWLTVIVPWLRDVALPLYATQPEVKTFVDTMLQNVFALHSDTMLQNVFALHSVPDGVIQFLATTFTDVMTKEFVNETLQKALSNNCSDVAVRILLATFPDAVKAATEVTKLVAWGPLTGGNTILHTLATAYCSTPAECRHTNMLCFTLVQKGASTTTTNAKGQTPAELASKGMLERCYHSSGPLNHHLIATLGEVAQFKRKKHHHLSLMHFRDWTTVSHAWCTPSAQLVALTVLMVGDTYKRGLLPRLPMDCWYRILNCIPRHELRQGGCEPAAEQAALAAYLAILREAKARVGAAAVV